LIKKIKEWLHKTELSHQKGKIYSILDDVFLYKVRNNIQNIEDKHYEELATVHNIESCNKCKLLNEREPNESCIHHINHFYNITKDWFNIPFVRGWLKKIYIQNPAWAEWSASVCKNYVRIDAKINESVKDIELQIKVQEEVELFDDDEYIFLYNNN